MSRLFDDGSSEYLKHTSAPVSDYPFSMACWFYTDNNTDFITMMGVGDAGSNAGAYLDQRGGAADQVAAVSGAWGAAITSSAFSLNTWHHACGVWAANNDRRAYLDGGSKGTDSITAAAISSWDSVTIGAGDYGSGILQYVSGRIAEAAIWNVALTDAEAAILGKGYSPLLIRPASLVFYVPLIRDNDDDIVGGIALTAYNTPSVAVHAPVFYPFVPYPGLTAAAVAEGRTTKNIESKIIRSNQIPIHQLQL